MLRTSRHSHAARRPTLLIVTKDWHRNTHQMTEEQITTKETNNKGCGHVESMKTFLEGDDAVGLMMGPTTLQPCVFVDATSESKAAAQVCHTGRSRRMSLLFLVIRCFVIFITVDSLQGVVSFSDHLDTALILRDRESEEWDVYSKGAVCNR